jgi:putative ABC transport system substrate-binding protein
MRRQHHGAAVSRRLLIALAAPAVLPATVARGQPAALVRRIAVLNPGGEDDAATREHLVTFSSTLARAGWIERQTVHFDYRWAGGDVARMRALARELAASRADVIFVRSTPATKAVSVETRTVPTVFVVVSGPVGDGLVTSLARPGGNITGFTNVEAALAGKWLQLLKEVAPGIARIACLFDPRVAAGGGGYYMRLLEAAAPAVGVEVRPAPVGAESDIERAVAGIAASPHGGIVVAPDSTTTVHRQRIAAAAAAHRVPAVYPFPSFAAEGGLISYGVDIGDLFRRGAIYVDRLLRGARPDDLPVQGPEKFELAINLRAARALGLVVPPALLAIADHLIE